MGIEVSKPKEPLKATKNGKSSKPNESKHVSVEIIGDDKYLPSDMPPIRVIFHDQVARSAVDSIRDAEIIVHQISKSLVVDVLNDKEYSHQFGKVLQDIFKYEYILEPTRYIIYWTMGLSSTNRQLQQLTKPMILTSLQANQTTLPRTISTALKQNILQSNTSIYHQTIKPFAACLMKETLVPSTAAIVASSLPYAEAATKEALKYSMISFLASEDAKQMARTELVAYLRQLSTGNQMTTTTTAEEVHPNNSSNSSKKEQEEEKEKAISPTAAGQHLAGATTSIAITGKETSALSDRLLGSSTTNMKRVPPR